MIVGYTLFATDGGGANGFVGGLSKTFLLGVTPESLSGTMPETVFVMFQMTFAIITPALVVGGFAFGLVFMATDPVSASTTPVGRLIYGAGIGILIWVIRTWGGYPDGVAFAVLLMNAVTPLINRWTIPRPFGGV